MRTLASITVEIHDEGSWATNTMRFWSTSVAIGHCSIAVVAVVSVEISAIRALSQAKRQQTVIIRINWVSGSSSYLDRAVLENKMALFSIPMTRAVTPKAQRSKPMDTAATSWWLTIELSRNPQILTKIEVVSILLKSINCPFGVDGPWNQHHHHLYSTQVDRWKSGKGKTKLRGGVRRTLVEIYSTYIVNIRLIVIEPSHPLEEVSV